jgi:hypothetical protein
MAFSDFTFDAITKVCGLTIVESTDLFSQIPPVALPAHLEAALTRQLPLASMLSTEKARSELLIAPLLFELKYLHADLISVFSGIDFSVEPSIGLNGRCDYILARNPQQLFLTTPVCVLVEAKKEDVIAGIPQCLAEMVAAQRFNRSNGAAEDPIFGGVSSGIFWRFMRLDGTTASVDEIEYHIQNPERIFGILTAMVLGQIPPI